MTRRLAFWSSFGLGLFWVGISWAEPSAADRATARSLAGEGYQALQNKDYAAATDRFSRADALVHAPTLMIDWARSLVGLGKLVEAQERYEQILREGVEPKAPKSWHRALTDASTELGQLKPRLAWITISVSGSVSGSVPGSVPGSEDAVVTIDDVPVPPAAIGVRRAVNPGSLQVRVEAKGFLTQTRTIELKEGAEEAAPFQLEPDPNARAVSPVQAPPPPAKPRAEPHPPTAVYVAFAASGAGLVLGAVTGAVAMSKRSDLTGVCDANYVCQSTQTDTLKAYHTYGTVSVVAFAVGIAGAGVGMTLWALNRSSSKATTAGVVVVHPYFGLGTVGAVGSF